MTYNVLAADPQINKQPLLTISIVTFNPDFDELKKTLDSLKVTLKQFVPGSLSITIVDNSVNNEVASFLRREYPDLPITLVQGQGNIGFGRAHNIAIQQMGEFHLILNPDIQLAPDALVSALTFMRANENCGLLSPYAVWPNGQRQYLCKRYPAVFDLILRGFAPRKIRSLFSARLGRYEMQTETQEDTYWHPPIVSGCFMFFRSTILRKAGGFSNNFFLYFEDFDLSLRVHKIADTAYVPTVRVIHAGGHASTKGFWHIKIFIQSAITFYRAYGVKLF
ncbi:glycosyltransferase family 2 protein [Brucella anthropi]|uniref:Glycosyl transferase family 2 n=1 Tax=Brucella anthropi (strain ATCC 49188 / DSM 6882 / CCUG 24695 / JCM 21032 / LMG 3331 / NBRC 15819 / NCTC 12168 / Alc 37) TaxID=439375 RepID=A6X2H9_BRUA4|nr:glycosyltransferase family 2 protein [Brucella anthropi]ABS15433.1 glycosyl transferase family 2 [Brucella anthropi ATCC 49188]QQC24324.1 glycosyltransferase family 2 protein [Brucella anthropi]SUA61383.1 dTDP-Rha:alpha-D-GlcNAc-pyrophosphate polyprenol, alpha-3-L-rhamnosyltransferase [Brucella anthropi]